MVLVLAALYSLYRSNSDEQNKKPIFQTIQEDASCLYQHAVLRCRDNDDTTTTMASDVPTTDFAGPKETSPLPFHNTPQPTPSRSLRQTLPPPTVQIVEYPSHIKQRWMDATFGKRFLRPDTPQHGRTQLLQTGFATVSTTLSHSSNNNNNNKLGLTLGRLSMGVCVSQVLPHCEASHLVPQYAILHKINGIALLEEPTRYGLEFLWYHHQQSSSLWIHLELLIPNDNNNDPLTIHHVILTGGLKGIVWGPAAPNLAVISKTKHPSVVPKHSLLACVNGRTFIDHSYLELGRLLKQSPTVQVTTVLLDGPQRKQQAKAQQKHKQSYDDGVEIQYVQFSYALSSLLYKKHRRKNNQDPNRKLAERVAACQLDVPPPPTDRHGPTLTTTTVTPLPTVAMETILTHWDALDSLRYCLHQAQYGLDDHVFVSTTCLEDAFGVQAHVNCLLLSISVLCSNNSEHNNHDGLSSHLLNLSRQSESFCQQLYFLLQSTVASFDKLNVPCCQSIVALLNCLELLRFAESSTGRVVSTTNKKTAPQQKIHSPKRALLKFLRKKDSTVSPTRSVDSSSKSSVQSSTMMIRPSPSLVYDNMTEFLSELDSICLNIETVLIKSFRQKLTDWATVWNNDKESALSEVTGTMRESLSKLYQFQLVNPVENSELLSSVEPSQCYILPSAHFPILLTFGVSDRRETGVCTMADRLYRTKLELISLRGCKEEALSVQAAVGGSVETSGESKLRNGRNYWAGKALLEFESRSSWGAPNTLSLRILDEGAREIGFCWMDLSEFWKHGDVPKFSSTKQTKLRVWPIEAATGAFDDHGALPEDIGALVGGIKLELRITTESINPNDANLGVSRKRHLLYKHDDDLRQEAFAVQFVRTCDSILKGSGLDMNLLTFDCCPVGSNRGFVEWVPGSVPLSDICRSSGSILSSKNLNEDVPTQRRGVSKFESLRKLGGQKNGSLRQFSGQAVSGGRGSIGNNPIQDYLRSVAFHKTAPYMIRRSVMDTYVKSCAGYSVVMYILGVGDRHLDNLLLNENGSFFHCDYSFILGRDPKKSLPMRVTEDMIHGMGGKESDNYAKFLSCTGAAFLCLRRPENVRVLLSMVRLMEYSKIPDISENQSLAQAIAGLRDRLRLDLTDDEAINFVEELVESSLSNKLWLAVDAFHHLGKQF